MNFIHSQPKRNLLNNALMAVLLAMPISVFAQVSSENCRALTILNNNLWLTKPDGTPVVQLTTDGKEKGYAAVSPNGKMIAYVEEYDIVGGEPGQIGDNLKLIDIHGKFLADIDAQAEGGIFGLDWIGNNLLRVQEHVHPRSSNFHFVKIPTGAITPASFQQLPVALGGSCTPSPNYKLMACRGGDFIDINGIDRYFTSPFVSATKWQTLNVAIGSTVTTSTVPPFEVEVSEVPDEEADKLPEGTVLLSVTAPTPDSEGNEGGSQYIRPGDTMFVPYLDASANSEVPTTYGFIPTRHQEKHKQHKEEIVTVDVMKSLAGDYKLEGDLAWDLHGRRIAAVEANGVGQRFLVILDRQKSDENNDGKDEQHDEDIRFGIDPKDLLPLNARELLPIDGPIRSIEFTSDTHIRVVGATKVFDQDIPAFGDVPANTNYAITDALPERIPNSGDPASTSVVLGWVCQ